MQTPTERQISLLHRQLTQLGSLIVDAVQSAVNAFIYQDAEQAQKALACDRRIDQMEKQIESLCFRLLSLQPLATMDFRMICAALKMITDAERIGDQAGDISEISLYIDPVLYHTRLAAIEQMAQQAVDMVKDSINAFVQMDIDLAYHVILCDDSVDERFLQIKENLIDLTAENIHAAHQSLELVMVAKYLERVGDHAVNIAEWAIYMVTGEHLSDEHRNSGGSD